MAVQCRIFINDPVADLEAYVVVDSFVQGSAMGGTRMTSTVDVNEVANLARSMTFKLALADLPMGGAKAGIRSGLPAGPERDRRLAIFGRAIAPLLQGGVYLGVDQGISFRDRDVFLKAAQFEMSEQERVGQLPCSWTELWERCSDMTGFGVCEGLDAASRVLQLDQKCHTVAIQGFGAVGRSVAMGLERRGFRVVAVADYKGTVTSSKGLPIKKLLAATDASGTIDRMALPQEIHCIDRAEAWLDIDADVLVLAAGGNAVREENMHRVRAQVIVEGGNLVCSEAAHTYLAERQIPVLPAIVVNAGGAIVTGLIWSRLTPDGLNVEDFVKWLYKEVATRIRRNIALLFDRSLSDPRPLSEIAESLAQERVENLQTLDLSSVS